METRAGGTPTVTSWHTRLQNVRFLGRIALRKPRFLLRLASGFVGARLRPRPRLRFMDVAVGYDCNMRCAHCSATGLDGAGVPLTLAEYERFASSLAAAGCLVFHFTGGEPLLRPDLEDLIGAFRPRRSAISIQSNGLLATPERLASLRAAGADIFNVSIDSGLPEEHDAFRRTPGAFERAWAAVDAARSLGFRVSVSTCITHGNLGSEGLRRVIELTRRRGIWCYFNLAVPAGAWRDSPDAVLTPEDQVAWRRLVAAEPHCRIDLSSNWRSVGCGAAKEKAYLTPSGDVMPCPFIPVALGSLRREPISRILSRARRAPEFGTYWPRCLAAEEPEFVARTPCYGAGYAGPLPAPWREVPWLAEAVGRDDA